jgi:hypothetical protein
VQAVFSWEKLLLDSSRGISRWQELQGHEVPANINMKGGFA